MGEGDYACADEALVDALAAMAVDRTRGWWEEYRGVLPPVFLDVAEVEHHAKFLREVVITHVAGLLQTADYARAVFGYMRPELPESEVAPRVEHRMRRRGVIEGDAPTPYETIVHEFALRVRVADRRASPAQLRFILEKIEAGHVSVRVIPAFIDAQPQLEHLRTLLRRVEKASLDPLASRDFVHRLTKEL